MVFEKLAALIGEQFGISPDKVTMDTNFVNDLGANSIDFVELMLSVEETFGLQEIDEDVADQIHTVEDVVKYISDRI